MADLRIVDAPLLSTVKGTEKIPTGGEGNFSISVNQVADFAKLKWTLATEGYVDNAVGNVQADLNLHKINSSNPHGVTKAQVGLANVDNTADIDKPIGSATQAAITTLTQNKAEKTYVDMQLNSKADKATTYTKTESDSLVSTKSDTSYVNTKYSSHIKTFLNTGVALSNTVNGEYFFVISNDSEKVEDLYLNVDGVATNQNKSELSSLLQHNSILGRDVTGAHQATSISTASGVNQQQINDFGGAKWWNKPLGYDVGSTVKLENGDIVKNTIADNTANPNVDMVGWVKENSASQIFDASGDSQQVINNKQNQKFELLATPEQFGCKANDPSFDNTIAMNAALASGSTLYADATKTYYVSGALVGKGQPLVGGFKISSSKKVRPEFSEPIGLAQTTSPDVPDPSNIKFCFVQRSHDLVEFFKLRELGFNTILHYDLYLAGGTIQAVLDNAKTAGLRVIVGTKNRSPNVDTQVAFWSAYDSHPALYAYSMFDEPVARVISLETQNAKLSKYRAMTEKPLTVTEYYFTSLSSVPVSFDYDIYFIHAYARNWTDTDVSVKVNKDLAAARKNSAYYTSIFENKRIVPVIGLFISSTADGFSNNVDQINRFATIYGQTHTGSLGVFIWDVPFLGNLGNNLSFQKTWQKCLNTESPKRYKSICFGQGSSLTYNFGLESIIDSPIKTFDSSYAQNTNAFPVRIRTGTPESLFVTTAADATYAGIAFKTDNATYYSNILISKFGTVYLWLTDTTSTFVGTINFYLSNDGGQTKTLVGTATSTTIDLTFSNPFTTPAILIIEITSTSAASEYFRRFLRGMIMSSDW